MYHAYVRESGAIHVGIWEGDDYQFDRNSPELNIKNKVNEKQVS
jgi:hypothetical protein